MSAPEIRALSDQPALLTLRVAELERHAQAASASVPLASSPPGSPRNCLRAAASAQRQVPSGLDEVGRWVSRSLDDSYRGSSGRERLPLSSRVYILARDYHNQVYDRAYLHHLEGHLALRQAEWLPWRFCFCGSSGRVGSPSRLCRGGPERR